MPKAASKKSVKKLERAYAAAEAGVAHHNKTARCEQKSAAAERAAHLVVLTNVCLRSRRRHRRSAH